MSGSYTPTIAVVAVIALTLMHLHEFQLVSGRYLPNTVENNQQRAIKNLLKAVMELDDPSRGQDFRNSVSNTKLGDNLTRDDYMPGWARRASREPMDRSESMDQVMLTTPWSYGQKLKELIMAIDQANRKNWQSASAGNQPMWPLSSSSVSIGAMASEKARIMPKYWHL